MKIPLTGGAYQSRSVIAAAQRCLNLYPELLPQEEGEPAPVAHFPTPGLRLLIYTPELPVRAVRQAANGNIYVVAGKGVYRYIPATLTAGYFFNHLGDITPGKVTPASMMDNGLDLLIVDGSPNGWSVSLADDTFTPVPNTPGGFVGGDRVDLVSNFFVLNMPGTQYFYWSGLLALTFDTSETGDLAAKSGASDLLVTLVVAKKEVILLGERTGEIFYNAAILDPTTGFLLSQFAGVDGTFIDHGIAAKYSAASNENTVFWLSRDRAGKGIVMKMTGYQAARISTYAIETELTKYSRIDDAIGFVYQLNGHVFYVLTFPAADHTWVYDATTGQWHEWLWIDSNGNEHAHRAMCVYPCFGELLAGDRQYGNLYALDPLVHNDWGFPIKRERSFPHMLAEGRRLFYREFLADMETGTGPSVEPDKNLISLAWSDDRGRHFGNPVTNSLGGLGDTQVSLQWQRLGMARDRVFKLSWAIDAPCALQGAWITFDLADNPLPEPAQPQQQRAPA
jgi:hypothetical protein